MCGDAEHPINIDVRIGIGGGARYFIGAIGDRRFGIGADAPDGADVAAVWSIEVGLHAAEIGLAIHVVPVRVVVGAHAEVRATDDFEIVGGARVADGEVIGGGVRGLGELVRKGGVRVADDLAVAVVFHHDHEDVIEAWDAFGHRPFIGERRTHQRGSGQQGGHGLQIPLHFHRFFLSLFFFSLRGSLK